MICQKEVTSIYIYYDGELIACIRDLAAEENTHYLEIMTSQTNSDEVRQIVEGVPWNDNLTILRYNLLSAGLNEICMQKAEKQESYDRISRDHATPDGRNVTVRYNYEALRFYPPKEVFSDLLQAFEIANRSSIIQGITLVGDEADSYSIADYHKHMEMIAFLHSVYPNVSLTFHAGELTPLIGKKPDLVYHIADAINTCNASRIGHGVDISFETDHEKIMAGMAANNIPVEILLTSNQQILGINCSDHPVSMYLEHEVPVILATDDPGVEGTNLTQEYVNFTISHPSLSYEEIREINLNSIRYSFLPTEDKERIIDGLLQDMEEFEESFTPGSVVIQQNPVSSVT